MTATAHFDIQNSITFGWRITHKPSNYLLTPVGFCSEGEALEFAQTCEILFEGGENWLDRTDRGWIREFFYKHPHWMSEVFHSMSLRGGYERFSMAEVKRIAQRAKNG